MTCILFAFGTETIVNTLYHSVELSTANSEYPVRWLTSRSSRKSHLRQQPFVRPMELDRQRFQEQFERVLWLVKMKGLKDKIVLTRLSNLPDPASEEYVSACIQAIRALQEWNEANNNIQVKILMLAPRNTWIDAIRGVSKQEYLENLKHRETLQRLENSANVFGKFVSEFEMQKLTLEVIDFMDISVESLFEYSIPISTSLGRAQAELLYLNQNVSDP